MIIFKDKLGLIGNEQPQQPQVYYAPQAPPPGPPPASGGSSLVQDTPHSSEKLV